MKTTNCAPAVKPNCPHCKAELEEPAGSYPIPGKIGPASLAWDECPHCGHDFYAMHVFDGGQFDGSVEIGL